MPLGELRNAGMMSIDQQGQGDASLYPGRIRLELTLR